MPVTIQIDSQKCKKDGLCAAVCPGRVFDWTRGRVARVVQPQLCVLCGQCLAVCPSGAITHSDLDTEDLVPIDRATWPQGSVLADFVAARRSIRAYKKRPVPRDMLERVAKSAGYAPTGAFGEQGRIRNIVIVTGDDAMRTLAESTVSYMRKLASVLDRFMVRTAARFSKEARAGLTALPDLRMRLERWEAGENVITYDAPAALFVVTTHDTATPHEDCDAALMTILMTSHALGLGACWNGWIGHAATGAHVRGFTELSEFLGLPKENLVVEAATVGWPRFHHHSIPGRKTNLRWIGKEQ